MYDFVETSYNQIFVIASYALSVLGSYLSLNEVDKLLRLKEQKSLYKIKKHTHNQDFPQEEKQEGFTTHILVSGILFGGLAVWSMHFMGQVALRLPTEVNYNIWLTILSFITVTLSAIIALRILIINYRSYKHLIASGFILGSGVIAMHYMGMYSMQFDGLFFLDIDVVFISIAIALFISPAALWLACRARSFKTRFMAAILLGGGISAVHYSGTAAANFICN